MTGAEAVRVMTGAANGSMTTEEGGQPLVVVQSA